MTHKATKVTTQTGLDIGNSYVKAVQLTGKDNDLVLSAFDIAKVEEKLEGQRKALESVAKKLSIKEVNISVSGPWTVVRYIELPKMTYDELKSSMKFEAEKYIPFSIKDVILDCQIIETTPKGKIKVLLAAAKKDMIAERVNLLEKAGLSVSLIDCDAFAVSNAFVFAYPEIPASETIALMNVGERFTTLNILRANILQFTRELQVGGWDFAKAISEKMNIDMKAASELKEDPKAKLDDVIEISTPVIAHIAEEVRLSLSYYENQMGAAVDRIYAGGGLSSFPKLSDLLKEAVGMECLQWDPTKRLGLGQGVQKDSLEGVKYQLTVAVGLAMRSADDKD
jgi:type IV pilus assembly protein PilM